MMSFNSAWQKRQLATFTPLATKSMQAQRIHVMATMTTDMRETNHCAQAQPRIVLSSILNPSNEIGKACNQAPDSLQLAASKQALAVASGA